MSARFLSQDGIISNSGNKIAEIRLNTDYKLSDKIKINADANYRYNYSYVPADEKNVYNRILHGSLWAVPKYPNGTYGLSQQGNNPLMFSEISGLNKRYEDILIGNVKGEWEIMKGLKFITQFGARVELVSQKNYSNAYTNKDSITAL